MRLTVLLIDQRINSPVSQSASFVKHSCSHTWGKLCCVKGEVSASLWGILLTEQQVHDSLTHSLHQLCVHECAWACGDQMADNQSSGKSGWARQIERWLWWTKSCPPPRRSATLPRKLWRAARVQRQRGRAFFSLKCKKERRPSRLTAPFILYYPARLLTPRELCSQIDALLLWGCSWNIKLCWNIHMWVHLAESNWCATPWGSNGNVARPQQALADTPSSGPGPWLWFSRAYWVRPSRRRPDSGELM